MLRLCELRSDERLLLTAGLGEIEQIRAWLDRAAPGVNTLVGAGLLGLVAFVAYFVARFVLLRLVAAGIRKTRFRWDDLLLGNRVLSRASLAAPLVVLHNGIWTIPGVDAGISETVRRVTLAGLVLVGVMTVSAFLTAANDLYSSHPIAKGRPIKGYLQVVKIVVYLFAAVMTAALILDRSPWFFMTGLGAMTAVLLLIFRDTILSLVASVQIVSNDMVRIGDWIEMPKYGADGDVVDIALHTVKVQNWDKTVTTIPTYKLIEDSFRNWRAMQEAGGRRIKRPILLDASSIRFLEEADLERLSRFSLIEEYLERKKKELREANAGRDPGVPANVRRLTNLGTFRAYVRAYLQSRGDLHQSGMTQLVRQLAPTAEGIPLEIYVFTKTTAWGEYENIQADVFDHLLAIVPEFGLRVFQRPAGADFSAVVGGTPRAPE